MSDKTKSKIIMKMYVHRHEDGSEKLHAADMSEYGPHWGACVGAALVTCEYVSPNADTKQALIESLERNITREQAESQIRVNALEARINKLKEDAQEGVGA